MSDNWIAAPPPTRLTGDEAIAGTSRTVRDFWAWSTSDLRDNTTRGVYGEYLVACALGVDGGTRIGWDTCDVRLGGHRVEVKTSAYLQSWDQRALSKVVFSGLRAKAWDARAGLAAEDSYNADVYVFALVTATEHSAYDQLDTSGWSFWVLPVRALAELGVASISLSTVQRLAGDPVSYPELGALIQDLLA